MVDDGSTDGSAAIARALRRRATTASGSSRRPNGGLSAARNTGIEAATGEFLAFLDSDDVLPPTPTSCCWRAGGTGSDFATGNVHRLTATGTVAGAVPAPARSRETRLKTHITRFRAAARRPDRPGTSSGGASFWDEHGFRFPEGMLHEDIPVVIPAHFLARSRRRHRRARLLLPRPRGRRTSRSPSAAPRRSALLRPPARRSRTSRDYLAEHGPRSAHALVRGQRRRRGPALLPQRRSRSPTTSTASCFLERVNAFFDRIGRRNVFKPLPAIDRLKWHLVRRRMMPELLEVLRFQREEMRETPPVRDARALVRRLSLPHRPRAEDPALDLPAGHASSRSSTQVDELRWEGETLQIGGYAFIRGHRRRPRGLAARDGARRSATGPLSPAAPGAAPDRASRRESTHRPDATNNAAPGAPRRLVVGVRGHARRAAAALAAGAGATAASTSTSASARAASGAGACASRWTPRSGRGRTRRARRRHAGARRPGDHGLDPGPRRGPLGGAARAPARRRRDRRAQARCGCAADAKLKLELRPHRRARRRWTYPLARRRRRASRRGSRSPTSPTSTTSRVAVVAARRRTATAATASSSRPSWRPGVWQEGDREIALRRSGQGDAVLEDRRAAPGADRRALDRRRRPRARGRPARRRGGARARARRARPPDRARVPARAGDGAGRFRARVTADAHAVARRRAAAAPGLWELPRGRSGRRPTPPACRSMLAEELHAQLPIRTEVDHKPFALGTNRDGDRRRRRPLRPRRRTSAARYNQRRAAQRRRTARARSEPLRDAVVYTSFGGRQCSDSPRAIHDGARAPRRAARAPLGGRRRDARVPEGARRCARAAASTTRRSPARATSSPTTTSPSGSAAATTRCACRPGTARRSSAWASTSRRCTRPSGDFEPTGTSRCATGSTSLSPNRFTTPILRTRLRARGRDARDRLSAQRRARAARPRRRRPASCARALGHAGRARARCSTRRRTATTSRDRRGRYRLDLQLDVERLRDGARAPTP